MTAETRDALGRPIGQHIRTGDNNRQHGGREGNTGKFRGADVTDDCCIDRNVDRFNCEGTEGWNRERPDSPVDTPRVGHPGRSPTALYTRSSVAEATV